MTFSILCMEDGLRKDTPTVPLCFVDLHLDQVVDAITADKQEYDIKPFFYLPLQHTEEIIYRQEVMRDLENPTVFASLQAFAQTMRKMRGYFTQIQKLHYKYQKERWFLDAAMLYCNAVISLFHAMDNLALQSRGLLAFRTYLMYYSTSEHFTSFQKETTVLYADASKIMYCLHIKGNSVRVSKYEAQKDYSTEITNVFAKFWQGAVKDYKVRLHEWQDMNHVEVQILQQVARLYPDIFFRLDDYCARNNAYLDETLVNFDREIQFYLAYLEHIARFKQRGLSFCYPRVSATVKEVYDYAGFDMALAYTRLQEKSPVVCNDFHLQNEERVMVVSGPNQGGKTTFARMFGQVQYLASLGCPVPGREACLFVFDSIWTHFEKEEQIKDLHSKLEDDLIRIHDILRQATPASILIMNEIFTSTTVSDALFLSKKIMEEILSLDVLCVWVTFIDELAAFSAQTISMVSTIVPENPAQRTYKVVRKPADGLAYAFAIAEKYRLTYDALKERIP